MVDRGAKIQAINFSQDHGRLSIVQKIHAFVCGVCVCNVCNVCVVVVVCALCVCVCVCVCVVSCVVCGCACGMCVLCFGGVWCVVVCCVVCGVWCVCVARLDIPCAGSNRLKNASVFNMRAFCRHTRKRFEPTHGDFLNLHGVEGGRRGFLISLSSLSLSLVPFSFSALSSPALFSSLSVTMTMIIRPVGFLCTQSSDLPECQCAWASVHSLLAEHIRSMQKKNCLGVSCASLVPLEMSGLAFALKMGVVFGCV